MKNINFEPKDDQNISEKGSSIYDVHKKWPIFEPPTPTIRKNEQQIYCLKTIESTSTWKISRLPQPSPCRRH